MGINIGILEMEAPSAPCRELRSKVIKVHPVDVAGFEDAAIYDEFVPYDEAKAVLGDWDAFVKRNRFNEDADAVYLEKVKKDADLEVLRPIAQRVCTGWVSTEGMSEDRVAKLMEGSEDVVTGWDQLDFDEMNEMCANCPLSWDKGRGCIGAFGPDNSLLPEIAGRHDCPIVASVPQAVAEGRRFTSKDAEQLLKEVEILKVALPEEGKMMVRRYSGPVERMELIAQISVKEGCGFYFF